MKFLPQAQRKPATALYETFWRALLLREMQVIKRVKSVGMGE